MKSFDLFRVDAQVRNKWAKGQGPITWKWLLKGRVFASVFYGTNNAFLLVVSRNHFQLCRRFTPHSDTNSAKLMSKKLGEWQKTLWVLLKCVIWLSVFTNYC